MARSLGNQVVNRAFKALKPGDSLQRKIEFFGLISEIWATVSYERDTLKTQLKYDFGYMLKSAIEKAETGTVSNVPLFSTKYEDQTITLSARVSASQEYTDLEALRGALGVSERRFQKALEVARRRRTPAVSFVVSKSKVLKGQ